MNRRRLVDAAITSGGQLIQQGSNVILGIVLARFLGAADYGVVSVLRSIQLLLTFLAALGLDVALLRHIPLHENSPARVRALLVQLRLLIFLVALVAMGFVAGGIGDWLERDYYQYDGFKICLLITVIAVPFMADSMVLGAVYRTQGRPGLHSILTLYVQPVIRLLLVIFSIALGYRVIGVAIALALAAIASAAVVYSHLAGWRPYGSGFRQDSPRELRAHVLTILTDSVWMGASIFIYTLLRNVDVMLLGALSSLEDAGIYSALNMLAQVIFIYPQALAQTLGPTVARLYQKNDLAGIRDAIRQFVRNASIVVGFLFGGVVAFSDQLHLMLGASFSFSTTLAFLLASAWMINGISMPTGYALSMTGRHRSMLAVLIFGIPVMVVCCLLLIPQFGAVGCAIGLLVSSLTIEASRQALIYRMMGSFNFELTDLVPILFGLGLAFAIRSVTITAFGATVPAFFFECFIYGLLYIVVTIALMTDGDIRAKIRARIFRQD